MLENILLILIIINFFALVFFVKNIGKEKVFLKEKYLRILSPIQLEGIPDLVTIQKNKLRLYDLKTRKNKAIFKSDIVQLSAYKYLLEKIYHKEVIEGYIIVQNNNFKEKVKIEFLSEKELLSIYNHYVSLQYNPAMIKMTKNKKVCEKCGFFNKKCFPQTPI